MRNIMRLFTYFDLVATLLRIYHKKIIYCLLYTSDAADDWLVV